MFRAIASCARLPPSSSVRFASSRSNFVQIVEVGPRDGLQNEKTFIPTSVKLGLISNLAKAGLRRIEATAFVSPKWVPQMADQREVMEGIRAVTGLNFAPVKRGGKVEFSVLTPNLKGAEAAVESGADEIAIFGSASEQFSKKNINCSISESLLKFEEVMHYAKERGVPVRGYVSCVAGCPYQGPVPLDDVVRVVAGLQSLGCREISLGDTIGVCTPNLAVAVVEACKKFVDVERLAVHFHDTHGCALANIHAVLPLGVRVVDTSLAGLGGCPYAGGGATGNVATEDVVYMLHGMGYETGVDLEKVVLAGEEVLKVLGGTSRSRAGQAILSKILKREAKSRAGTC
jgi:hydroxymethylglutaryl-CoA lyase